MNMPEQRKHLSVIATTIAFDTYWRFAAERLAMFYRRRRDPLGPWTSDPILRFYRFTNVFRAADRVSQYLIREVQYREDRCQEPNEVFFRTLLFKIFNKIETWEALEAAHGPLALRSVDLDELDRTLTLLHGRGRRIYSAAYIMPAPALGRERKHSNHLALIARMMADRLPDRLRRAPDLEAVYEGILAYPGLGPFLAFQYAIDLNYSTLLDFEESTFVVAGPGALDGISKCFSSTDGRSPEWIIRWVTDRQDIEFAARGLDFEGLFGRPLQPIDCQNLFCEISKYTRVAHPELHGVANRQRIKQTYKRHQRALDPLAFPPRWNLDPGPDGVVHPPEPRNYQAVLL
jgi:alpha-glutamyl/putrescinyl thymine pyrophosphorylase clade 1